MPGIMGYNYPFLQEHIYSIQQHDSPGYICPMEITFKKALRHAMGVVGSKSLRSVAMGAGVSYHILKNIDQEKSQTPNAEAASRIADYFGVSVADFYAGNIPKPDGEPDPSLAEDIAGVSTVMRHLHEDSRARVRAFAEALRQTEQENGQTE